MPGSKGGREMGLENRRGGKDKLQLVTNQLTRV